MRRKSELSADDILTVFEKNFGYRKVPTPLGYAIPMSSREAFLFSNVTGAGYLDNTIYPFTPKGLMKIFYNAFDYNFVTGIFEKTTLKNTPYILSKAKPFLFKEEIKYIVPIEFDSDIALQGILNKGIAQICDPCQFIVMRVEKSKKGNGLESFMEYLASEFFKRNGFIVENQIPLAYSVGSPDFGGYSLYSIINATKKYLPQGFHIIELAMIRLKIKSKDYSNERVSDNTFIVGEAKTSTKQMNNQIKKYLDTGLFDWGIELHPTKDSPTEEDRGLLTLDDELRIKYIPPKEDYKAKPIYSKEQYGEWLENYMKYYLLSNFTNDELIAYYKEKKNKESFGSDSLINFVNSLTPEEIVTKIEHL